MALCAALPLNPEILWRGFDRCRASPEGIESASGASSSAFCFPGESECLNKHCAPKSESLKDLITTVTTQGKRGAPNEFLRIDSCVFHPRAFQQREKRWGDAISMPSPVHRLDRAM
jgi:hypothetical protein